MTITQKLLATAALAGGLAMMTAAPAAAYVACNGGDCWHSDSQYAAPPGATFAWHPDDWYFHQHWDADRHFRDYHEGRGYYKDGVWITL